MLSFVYDIIWYHPYLTTDLDRVFVVLWSVPSLLWPLINVMHTIPLLLHNWLWAEQYRLQQGKKPSRQEVMYGIGRSCLCMTLFTLPLSYFGAYYLLKYQHLVSVSPFLPSWTEMFLYIAFYLFVEDLTLYIIHRALHEM